MAKVVDLNDIQGNDIFYTVEYREDNVVTPIPGGSIWVTLKENLSDTDAEAALQVVWGEATGARGPLSNPSAGLHEIHLTNVDTANLNKEYFYDIKFKDANGVVTTLLIGKWDFTHARTVVNS